MRTSSVTSFLVMSAVIVMVTSQPTNNKVKLPTHVFGICNHIESFYVPEVKSQGNHYTTKVQLNQGKKTAVFKFKVGLRKLCNDMTKVMTTFSRKCPEDDVLEEK